MCGKGKLFRSYLKVAQACSACATDFKAEDTGDGPVVFVILIAGFVACAGLFVSLVAWNWSIMTLLAVWPASAALMALILMPVLKGVMIAAQIRHKVRD
ncbi:hypothetical protein ABAC402_14240 [Asticcacaulis sp. AC402]|nr:hypothetical protein ABAC402_14240 [Asticcacaulis sp. AC402]